MTPSAGAASSDSPAADARTCEWAFDGIGTGWQIDTPRPLTEPERGAVLALVERFDRDWSRFRPDSVVETLRTAAGRHRLPDDADPLITLYRTLYALTDGAMSPAVGGGLEALGYDARYSLRAGDPVPAPSFDDVDWSPPYLTTPAPFVLDVGAAGKGYLADQVAALVAGLLTDGAAAGRSPAFTVDASGDLVRRGPALRVALEHPLNPRAAVGVAALADRALCGSAVNRRAWGDGLHHVLDARTGVPVPGPLATWVVADDARTADALATALFFTAPERLAEAFSFEYVIMPSPTELRRSAGFPGEIFS
ncbi:MAG: FAD:protein FMN transferase [Gordonia sp. (in: high G+C Gram-positive bacteria)]|uniref:FAD:protein FMN transferase n=1 Tax=Gordonia sp. (in: high G+C Gram-positive bacteria) TaxID=84139 RepID=UPI0039E2443C